MNNYNLFNAKMILPTGTILNGNMLISRGKILQISNKNLIVPDIPNIDCDGQYLSPGFVDMHVHGGGGHDFMDNTVEAFLNIAQTHAQYGTTAMMPTTLSCEQADLKETITVYEKALALNMKGAAFVGLHIEGPYFAMSQKGAQDPRYIRNPDPTEYKEIVRLSKHIKRWSAAPELPGAIEFGRYLCSNGIMPAIAHTDAVYEEVLEAFEAGYRHATHFYSCMSGVSRRNAYRYAGVVESAYLLDEMSVEIIVDGIHLPAPLLQLVHKVKGSDRIALITDAMRGAGMPEGTSMLGSLKSGTEVIIEDGVAKLPDRSSFAGSVATMNQTVRIMRDLGNVTLIDAVRMATEVPARILGLNDCKGSLKVGLDADIVVFNTNLDIALTCVEGRIVYSKLDQST